jgi:hypothetical protein
MTYGSACWPCFATIAARATLFCHANDIAFCFIGTQAGQNRLDLSGQPVLAGRGLPRIDFLVEKFMQPFSDLAMKHDAKAATVLTRQLCPTVLVPFYEFIEKPTTQAQIEAIQRIGWELPKNTGGCSTNCMINELGRHIMRKRFGFDLYQIIEANERRLSDQSSDLQIELLRPELDQKAVTRGAKMIKLSDDEVHLHGIEITD